MREIKRWSGDWTGNGSGHDGLGSYSGGFSDGFGDSFGGGGFGADGFGYVGLTSNRQVPASNEEARRTDRVFRCAGCIGGFECSIHGKRL